LLGASSPFTSNQARFLTGLIGTDICASRSPWLHEREADAQGVRLVYSLFDFTARGWDAADLPKLLAGAQIAGFSGLNVTHPFKQLVIAHLDGLSDVAQRIGAVNAVQFLDGKRIGHNTDVIGFTESMRAGLSGAELSHVVQVGAGGAGSATAHALLDLGVEHLVIFDKDDARMAPLVAKLSQDYGSNRVRAGADLAATLASVNGVVNATPLGMLNYPGSAVPVEHLNARLWVADIVYFPLETELLREAKLRGCRTLDGSGMVVHQAAAAFEIFTGLTANRTRMLRSFVDFVSMPQTKAA
jgi:shikimate dehydrogenase